MRIWREEVELDDDDDVESAEQCFRNFHFMVAAHGCDLFYVSFGMGLAVYRDYGGEVLEASSQAVVLRKAHQTPLTASIRAIILGFNLGPSISVPNMTRFGSAMGRVRKDSGKKRKVETPQTWIEEAEKFRAVTRVQWSEFLAWLSYSTQREWSESVRADDSFDI